MGTRAKQTTPPAVRRAVLQRDQHRCRVPGCKNATFLDIHHIQLRSEGGSNDLENLLSACGAHHRALHRRRIIIERGANGLRFLHADGRPYGEVGLPTLDAKVPVTAGLIIENKVASALRNLGFRDADVRAVLAGLREEASERRSGAKATADGAPPVMTTEHLLREALVRLGPRRGARR